MVEQIIVGVLSETLREKLKPGHDGHDLLKRVLNERAKIKILGEWKASGAAAGKTFVQFTPLEGTLFGRVLSVCKDHVLEVSQENPKTTTPAAVR